MKAVILVLCVLVAAVQAEEYTVDLDGLKKEIQKVEKELKPFKFSPQSEADLEKYCIPEDWDCLDENHSMWRVHRTGVDWCCPKYIFPKKDKDSK